MSTTQLREKIYDLIDRADDHLLIQVFALINDYYSSNYQLSDSEKKKFLKESMK